MTIEKESFCKTAGRPSQEQNGNKEIGKRTFKKRNVTLDSNVLISYVISKRDDTIVRKVVTKSITED